MIYLTLATGTDRWENGSLKEDGPIWRMVGADAVLDAFVVLKPEVADWCWENIGAYRIVEHATSRRFGPDEDDSWQIEFKSAEDMAFFKLRWM